VRNGSRACERRRRAHRHGRYRHRHVMAVVEAGLRAVVRCNVHTVELRHRHEDGGVGLMPALPSYLLGEFQFRNESDLKTIVEEAHNKACLPGRLEIPMESFVRGGDRFERKRASRQS